MKWLIPFIISFLSGFISLTAQQLPLHQFEIKEGSFMYDGKPITIHSGEMHLQGYQSILATPVTNDQSHGFEYRCHICILELPRNRTG